MKIATWNVERLKHFSALDEIVSNCMKCDADILVLTETDERIHLAYRYQIMTPSFSSTEHRVAIYSKSEILEVYPTYDAFTALCVKVETCTEPLTVYGTIMGILGNREKSFLPELKQQCRDIDLLVEAGHEICVCGDYNLSFSDNYYFTREGRTAIQNCFSRNDIELLTADTPECIDHIAISRSFVGKSSITVEEWNLDKKLSDHKGICVQLN